MNRVRAAVEQQPIPENVKGDKSVLEMHKAIVEAAMQGFEGSGISGKTCLVLRGVDQISVIIEYVDQFKNEMALYDLEKKEIFIKPTWSPIKFEDFDRRYASFVHLCYLLLDMNVLQIGGEAPHRGEFDHQLFQSHHSPRCC